MIGIVLIVEQAADGWTDGTSQRLFACSLFVDLDDADRNQQSGVFRNSVRSSIFSCDSDVFFDQSRGKGPGGDDPHGLFDDRLRDARRRRENLVCVARVFDAFSPPLVAPDLQVLELFHGVVSRIGAV